MQADSRSENRSLRPFLSLISSVYVLLKAYYDCQRNSRSLGAEKLPYIYMYAWYPGLALKKQDVLCICMKRMGLKLLKPEANVK